MWEDDCAQQDACWAAAAGMIRVVVAVSGKAVEPEFGAVRIVERDDPADGCLDDLQCSIPRSSSRATQECAAASAGARLCGEVPPFGLW